MSDGVVVRRAVTSGPAKVTGGAMTSGIHRTILQKSQGSQGRVPLTGKSGKSVLCALTVGGGEAFPGTLCVSFFLNAAGRSHAVAGPGDHSPCESCFG